MKNEKDDEKEMRREQSYPTTSNNKLKSELARATVSCVVLAPLSFNSAHNAESAVEAAHFCVKLM